MADCRINSVLRLLWVLSACGLPGVVQAQPAAEQQLYWWQDEIRSVAAEIGRARKGQVAEWPAMTVSPGAATLPLPDVAEMLKVAWISDPNGAPRVDAVKPIKVDGKLDDTAWQQATRFPVGPLFDEWTRGPFTLDVRVCRDANRVYLAIRAPRDLTDLRSLSDDGELFLVNGQPLFVGEGGGLPAESLGRDGDAHVVELAVEAKGPVTLAFPPELLRRTNGKLPEAAKSLGLTQLGVKAEGRSHYRFPSLWLTPLTVRLVPAKAAAAVAWSVDRDCARLTWEVSGPAAGSAAKSGQVERASQPGKADVLAGAKSGHIDLPLAADKSVYCYPATPLGDTKFTVEGFFYRESPAAELAAARQMAGRAVGWVSDPTGVRTDPSTAHDLAAFDRPPSTNSVSARDAYCHLRELRSRVHLSMLNAPLLFVKQHPYFAAHIYDDFYPWHPGGGIYVLENPRRFGAGRSIRTVIDPTTNENLGVSVYRDPDLHWDARSLVFAAKTTANGVTSLYEIGLDGRGLRRITNDEKHSDFQPAWLPDDRIVFISTRPKALVPCFNSGVGTLHTIRRDGSDLRNISVNNVNEFDPSILPDGRILFGRWEYVDKTALYMQSLWTVTPDGRMEEALFANNLAKPTAVLDAKPVPGSPLVAASLTPHNGQPLGAIATIDPRRGKNNLDAVTNFTAEYPIRMDQGLAVGPCDPCPLSADDILLANNAIGAHGIIELADRFGHRELVVCDPDISCYAPTLVKPRPRPDLVQPQAEPDQPGRFVVTDVYQGLTGVERGTVKQLRILEETARTSGLPPGGRWWNQAFLISWQGAYIVKNILGVVPVHEDGSAYFEAPPGRALYFEALDAEGRAVQRMRTFVQATPGVTRSCIGCHENKQSAALASARVPHALSHPPAKPQPESWGNGFVDYATMIQPILDRHCIHCHGGPAGIDKGLDLTGGWTWAFNISYESLIKRRLVGFLNCNNGSVHTSDLLPPRFIGSAAAPLAERLISGHGGRIPELTRAERDLILAWMDTNSNYYGSWDYTPHATCDAILEARAPLASIMQQAGCVKCHTPGHIGNDWINLQNPEWSRILRAPLALGASDGFGRALCRDRKARPGYRLVDQGVQPPDVVLSSHHPEWDDSGTPVVTFLSTADLRYQMMLSVIRRTRAEALAKPRVDMPGAQVVGGECRMQLPPPVPLTPPALHPRLTEDGEVDLSWLRSFDMIGQQYEVHRGPAAEFAPSEATRLGLTMAGRFLDGTPPAGTAHYALVVTSNEQRSRPVFTSVAVGLPPPPAAPARVKATALPGEVCLEWEPGAAGRLRYHVYRQAAGAKEPEQLTQEPSALLTYRDVQVEPNLKYVYSVRALDRRDQAGPLSAGVDATPLPAIREPVFSVAFEKGATAKLLGDATAPGRLHGSAHIADGVLQTGRDGFVTFEHRPEFDLARPLSVELRVFIEEPTSMPVVISCGVFNSTGWFIQRYGRGFRWHVGGVSCDGGREVIGRWTHLVATYDGQKATLYQDGKPVATVSCAANTTPHPGPLVIGQYCSQGDSYQVRGRIADVKIYQRVLRHEEMTKPSQKE